MTAVLFFLAIFSSLARAQEGKGAPGASPEEREGRALVEDLLSLRPPEIALYGVLIKTENSEGRRSEVPMRYTTTAIDEKSWEANYEGRFPGKTGLERITILHREGLPNEYRYTTDSESKPLAVLSASQIETPFADSDYWLADLGLEFLHWPQQRVIKHKITMRNTRPCRVLESINPGATDNGIARVLSWIDRESGALIYAEAYDRNRKHLKTFSLHGFKKVNGKWQATELRMLNERTDSRSEIRFQFQDKQ